MTSALKIKGREQDGKLYLVMSGKVDEASIKVFGDTFAASRNYPAILIDCNDVHAVNSQGLVHLTRFLGALNQSAVRLTNCPTVLLDCVLLIRNVFAHAKVSSFYAPYGGIL